MPRSSYEWLPRADILRLEEIARLVTIFARLGVSKARFTGGEPLLRRDLTTLIKLAAQEVEVTLTTNAHTLAGRAARLHDAGLARITVSLDTLRRARFTELTGQDALPEVLAGIAAVGEAGFTNTKINAVIRRGFNDDELADLLAFGRNAGVEVRFIEYMDVAGATGWSPDQVVSRDEILAGLAEELGPIEPAPAPPSSPARRYLLPDGTAFGIVAPTTVPFCDACDRARLTADGVLFTCLHSSRGTDLRGPLRAGRSDDALCAIVAEAWGRRRDRGAEERLSSMETGQMASGDDVTDPHSEMHTRGG